MWQYTDICLVWLASIENKPLMCLYYKYLASQMGPSIDKSLKGAAALIFTMFYMKDLNKQCILIPVSSKSVEKRRSCGRLNICKWTVMEAAIL